MNAANDDKINLRSLIYLFYGDITKLRIDCIVNSANWTLKSGGGVCGAIHRASGQNKKLGVSNIETECNEKYPNGCELGEAVITQAYELPCKYVIHTVGPSNVANDESCKLLANCYSNTLDLAFITSSKSQNDDTNDKNAEESQSQKIKQICFCSISTGTHMLKIEDASQIAVKTSIQWLEKNINMIKNKRVQKIVFCCFSESDLEMYKKALSVCL